MRIADTLIYILLLLCLGLAVTGGVHYSSPSLKLELSQIDAFAWAALALMALRKWKWGSWLTPKLEAGISNFLQALERKPALALGLMLGSYFVLHTWVSAWRFDSFHANAYDLGYVDQPLWATTRVGFLHSSLSRGSTYLGEHFAPVLGLVSAVYLIWDSIYLLFAFQTAVIASGSYLVYRLSRTKGIERGFSAFLALCYLIYIPIRSVNGFDFREDNLFIPVFLGALLAIETRRWIALWVLTALAWTVKENAPLFTAMIGGWLLLRRHEARRIQGAALIMASIAVFAIVNMKITPHFAGASDTKAVHRLGQFGRSNAEILSYIATHPFSFIWAIAKPVAQPQALKYFLQIFVPFLLHFPAAPLVALIALAGFVMNVVVNLPMLGFHYECLLIPFLFYVLVSAVARMPAERRRAPHVAALTLMSFLVFFGRGPVHSLRTNKPTERHKFVAAELAKIPQNASITTQSALHPHLDHRKDAFLFSPEPSTTDYVIFDFAPGVDRYGTPDLEGNLKRLDQSVYEKVFDQDHLVILKRRDRGK